MSQMAVEFETVNLSEFIQTLSIIYDKFGDMGVLFVDNNDQFHDVQSTNVAEGTVDNKKICIVAACKIGRYQELNNE